MQKTSEKRESLLLDDEVELGMVQADEHRDHDPDASPTNNTQDVKAFPNRWKQFFFALGMCTVCMYFNCVMQVIVQRRADRWAYSAKSKPDVLPDLGFDVLPHVRPGYLPDLFVGLSLGLTFLRFALTPRRLVILRRALVLLGWLFLLRGVSIVATVLPNPFPNCIGTVKHTNHPMVEGILVMVMSRSTCADVFFSGHTVNITLCALVWHSYSHVVPVWDDEGSPLACRRGNISGPRSREDLVGCSATKMAVWGFAVAGYIVIVGSHFHYTIDTFMAIVLTVLSWKAYHHYIRTVGDRPNLFNRFLTWFEDGAADALRDKTTPLTTLILHREKI